MEERQESYRTLIRENLSPDFVAALRTAANGGWAVGSDRFRREIEASAKRRAVPLPRRTASAR